MSLSKLEVTVEDIASGSTRPTTDWDNVVCCLRVPNMLLKEWHTNRHGASASYIGLMNDTIRGHVVTLDARAERLEESIRRRAGEVAKKVASIKQYRDKQPYLAKTTVFDVHLGETLNAAQLCDDLESSFDEVSSLEQRSEHSQEVISRLKEQLRAITSSSNCMNIGLPLNQVAERQRRRKLSSLKSSAEKALWFIDSFGLCLQSVTLQDSTTGDPLILKYSEGTSQSSAELSDETLHQSLYLLERFGVSDEFYHELSMVHTSLPRSYKVKRTRKALSDTIEIERLPAPYHGARRQFKPCLASLLDHELDGTIPDSAVAVKISGDGAQFSRTSKFLLLSFSLPFLSSNSLSGCGTHTFAVVKADEDFEVLNTGLIEVIEEVNAMIETSQIVIGGVTVHLDFYLGGDYKFLLMSMGLKAANSAYACLWCNIHNDKRMDTSITLDECIKNKRSQDDLIKGTGPGSKHPSLFKIQLDHVVIDELHLLLRISDKLIMALILRMAQLDSHARVRGTNRGQTSNMDKLLAAVQSCGIHFKVWSSKDVDGKFGFTAINSRQRLTMFRRLPPLIPDLVGGDKPQVFQQVFEEFLSVYLLASSGTLSDSEKDSLHQKAKDWLDLFLSLRSSYPGFQTVTPYMHILVYHVPIMVKQLGSIKRFTGQGVEKNNDDAKRNYFSSNRHDAAGDILVTEARIELLRRGTTEFESCVRQKRSYEKSDDAYWEQRIFQSRQAKRANTLSTQLPVATSSSTTPTSSVISSTIPTSSVISSTTPTSFVISSTTPTRSVISSTTPTNSTTPTSPH